MALWFLDFLLEHLSLFGKGTPQHQVSFGSAGGGVYVCVWVWVCEREWKMKQPPWRQWSHRQTGWVTDNTCCKIPSHLPWSVFIDLGCYALQTVAHTNGLFWRAAPLSFTLATHYTDPLFSFLPKIFAIFCSLSKWCLWSWGESWKELSDKYGLFPISSNGT